MGVAYCLLAHKNPAQIARLLRALEHPDNLVVLHYEKRAPRSEHQALAALARDYSNVHLLLSRPILWGRFSQVGTQLEGLERCLELGGQWSHFITLTGQDFPLRPQSQIIDELKSVPTTSFLSHFDPLVETLWPNVEERMRRIYIDSMALESLLQIPFLGRRLRRICGWTDRLPVVPFVRREPPSWFHYMGGSNHVILSRQAASYLAENPDARRTIQWLKSSGHPDESLFQSVLLNSPLADSVINDDRRAIFWEKPGAPSPLTLTRAHLSWLREAREQGKLFARKFDAGQDNEVLCEIEKDLGL